MRPVAAVVAIALLATVLMGPACTRRPPAAPSVSEAAVPANPSPPPATEPAPLPPAEEEGPDRAPAEARPQPAAAPGPARRVGGSGAWGLWEDSHGLIAGPLESPGNVWAYPHPQGTYLALWALVDGRNRAALLDLMARTLRELPAPEQEGVVFFLLGWLGDGRLAWWANDHGDPGTVYLVAETRSGGREVVYQGPEVRLGTLDGPSPVASGPEGELVTLQAGWLLLSGPPPQGPEVVAIRTREGGIGVMEEGAPLTRLPAAGPPERLARRGSAHRLGGQVLAVIDEPPVSGIYRLGAGGNLEPLSGPLRPGARPVAAAHGHLAYVYLGHEGWYLRIRPLEPLAPRRRRSRPTTASGHRCGPPARPRAARA